MHMKFKLRLYGLILLVFSVAIFVLYRFLSEFEKSKIDLYHASEECKIAPLEIWPSDLRNRSALEPLDCSRNGIRFTIEKPYSNTNIDEILPKQAWLDHGTLHLSPYPKSFSYKCDIFTIKRLDDYRSVYDEVIEDVKDGFRVQKAPNFMMLCQPRSQNELSWNADLMLTHRRFYFCGSLQVEQKISRSYNKTFPNVLLLGIDSMSRLSWLRYLPKTVALFQRLLINRGSLFEAYHVIGDGTTSNLLAILTGLFEQELPESRRFQLELLLQRQGLVDGSISNDKEYKGADVTPLNSFPWLWNEFEREAGYATHFIEDTPNWGTFQYRLQGFGSRSTPVHNYGRPCLVAAAQDEARYGKQLGCTASTPTHKVLLESLREFFYANPDQPKFSLTFFSEMIHEEPEKAGLVDNDIADLLDEIDTHDRAGVEGSTSSANEFSNTLLVLFSDHGPRMGKARLSLQGKLEERLPMLSIILPRRLTAQWPEAVAAMKANSGRLTSPFDVHASLRHLLARQLARSDAGSFKVTGRGQSLFKALPRQRSCEGAGIAGHWCTCVNWVSAPNYLSSQAVQTAADLFIATLNAATRVLISDTKSANRKTVKMIGLCHQLSLKKIVSAEFAEIAEDVIRFQRTSDRDGRIPSFLAHNQTLLPRARRLALRLHLVVEPKEAHFEAVLHFDPKTGLFQPTKNLDHIRRLDAFEEGAKCLDPQKWNRARHFCVCR